MTTEHPALPKLLSVLAEMGLRDIPMEYREEYIGYPGGGYTNRSIYAAGERYCADLTEKNPIVTAIDIIRRLPPKAETPQS